PLYSALSWLSFLFVYIVYSSDPAPAVFCPLSLHDALPILRARVWSKPVVWKSTPVLTVCRPCVHVRLSTICVEVSTLVLLAPRLDRKSTRLNSSHVKISYAVFCLKKKTELS